MGRKVKGTKNKGAMGMGEEMEGGIFAMAPPVNRCVDWPLQPRFLYSQRHRQDEYRHV